MCTSFETFRLRCVPVVRTQRRGDGRRTARSTWSASARTRPWRPEPGSNPKRGQTISSGDFSLQRHEARAAVLRRWPPATGAVEGAAPSRAGTGAIRRTGRHPAPRNRRVSLVRRSTVDRPSARSKRARESTPDSPGRTNNATEPARTTPALNRRATYEQSKSTVDRRGTRFCRSDRPFRGEVSTDPQIKSPLILGELRPTGVKPSVHTVVRPDSCRNPESYCPSNAVAFTASEHTRSTPKPDTIAPAGSVTDRANPHGRRRPLIRNHPRCRRSASRLSPRDRGYGRENSPRSHPTRIGPVTWKASDPGARLRHGGRARRGRRPCGNVRMLGT
jgi:hypothetical protein